MSNNQNYKEETTDQVVDSLSRPGQKIANQQKRKIRRKIKQGVTKAGIRVGKAIGRALVILAKVLLPYILVVGAVLLFISFAYFTLFEFTGTEKEYTKEYENEVTMNEDGIYMTSEKQMNKENKIINDFYRYFAGQSYWKSINDDNETVYSPDEEIKVNGKVVEVKDEYNREEKFNLPANLLYSLDEYMYSWTWKYPEQFIKPVNYDKDEFKLSPIADEDGMVIVESDEEDVETGEKTGETIISMRDYGLASVLKYNEEEDYVKTTKVKGEYIAKDIWNDEKKEVETISIKPEEFEVVMKPPEPIWLIDKVVTFAGNIEYEYENQETKVGDLTPGVSSDEKDPKTEIIYEEYVDPNCEIESFYNVETKLMEEREVCGKPITYYLKKYRSSESMIVEEKPAVVNTITDKRGEKGARDNKEDEDEDEKEGEKLEDGDKDEGGKDEEDEDGEGEEEVRSVGDDYLEDYLYNFESYVPIDVTDDLIETYEEKIDYDSYVFDYDGLLTDDYGFDLGSLIESDKFKYAYETHFDNVQKYSEEFGVDPFAIMAILTQESGGVHSNKYGIMQIYGGARQITANNAQGGKTKVSITIDEKADAEKSIRWGTAYYRYLVDYMDGNQYKAMQAYNLGEGTLMRIKRQYSEAWESDFGWLIHREWGRIQFWPNNPSASYGCMDFPEGKVTNGKKAAGDSCYLENTLRYYAGGELENIETDGDSAWNSVKNFFGSVFQNLIVKRDKDELVPKLEFVNHIKETRLIDILMTTKALDGRILFSEVEDYEDVELSFWEDGFMDMVGGTVGLSIQEILEMAPNPGGYWRPIILGNGIRVTSPFGNRDSPENIGSTDHKGVDIGAPMGTPVYASASGKVKATNYQNPGAGYYVQLDHGNGVETLYMHLSKWHVKPGETVEQGQHIGDVGSTGTSTGPHLHFELRINGIPRDPMSIVQGEGENYGGSGRDDDNIEEF